MSRTYKDQRKFNQKQESRRQQQEEKEPQNYLNEYHFDVMQTISPDWSNW